MEEKIYLYVFGMKIKTIKDVIKPNYEILKRKTYLFIYLLMCNVSVSLIWHVFFTEL